ncbi:MAG: hypothetical protein RIL09_02435 [Alphaproteobacteria bacterium]
MSVTAHGWSASRLLSMVVLAAGLAVCVVRLFLGYGYDIDTYLMLGSWQTMLGDGAYAASRFQGSPVAEFALGFAATLGGSLLANALVLACALVALAFAAKLAVHFGVTDRWLLLAFILSNGYVLVAASTSVDYMIALAPFVAGLYFLLRQRPLVAITLLAIAAGARLPFLLFGLSMIVLVLSSRRDADGAMPASRLVETVAAFIFISGLFYLPVWISHGLRFDWLTAATPDFQGLAGLVARFVYKLVYLFGPLGAVLGGVALLVEWRRRTPPADSPQRALGLRLCLAIIALHLVMFARIPVEVSYLVAAVPFIAMALLLLGLRRTVMVLIAAQVFANVVRIEMLDISHLHDEPCAPVIATGAHVRPHLEAGLLVRELRDLAQQGQCHIARMPAPFDDHRAPLPLPPVPPLPSGQVAP